MNWELPKDHAAGTLPLNLPMIGARKPSTRYLNALAVYFAGLAVSFPVQIIFLKDMDANSLASLNFLTEMPLLNWLCISSYAATSVALLRKSNWIWAYLVGSFLITGINNSFIAFTGWDYSATQAFLGSALFAVPLIPTLAMPAYRKMIWRASGSRSLNSLPRYNKRWRVEVLSDGQRVPATGLTINISESGALIHLNQGETPALFNLKLSEVNEGTILNCKARKVREAVLQTSGTSEVPVVGVQFLELNDEQREALQVSLTKKMQRM